MRDIAGKTVLITGGSAGVGLAAAQRFLQLGANIAISGRNAETLAQAAAMLGSPARVMTLLWDAAEVQRAEEMFAAVESRFGKLHVLVNNAGCNHRGALESLTAAQVQQVIDTNFRAPLLLTHAALPYLRRAGEGAIVNVASLAGHVPLRHEASYSATKFGLRGFSLSLAQELENSEISVSVVSPGPIETGFIMDDIEEVPDIVLSQPMSSAAEVAERIVACVRDGKAERCVPVLSGVLADIVYLFPPLARWLQPMMQRRGQRARALIRARQRRMQ